MLKRVGTWSGSGTPINLASGHAGPRGRGATFLSQCGIVRTFQGRQAGKVAAPVAHPGACSPRGSVAAVIVGVDVDVVAQSVLWPRLERWTRSWLCGCPALIIRLRREAAGPATTGVRW